MPEPVGVLFYGDLPLREPECGRIGSRFDVIGSHLGSQQLAVVEMTFDDIDALLDHPLPPSARRHVAWWANSGQVHSTAWTSAGYRVHRPDLGAGRVTFVRTDHAELPQVRRAAAPLMAEADNGYASWANPRSTWRTEEHLQALDAGMAQYVAKCQADQIFTGPSVHFYERTVGLVRSAASLEELADRRLLYDMVYATLTSWGMHRMGAAVRAKLTDFDVFSSTLRRFIEQLDGLWGRSILDVTEAEVHDVTKRLISLVTMPGITASEAPLVANTKTLHFLLPDLVPPMDRTYTARFFYGPNRGMVLPGEADDLFEFMFKALHRVACNNESFIRSVPKNEYLCLGHAKTLDNAIVGYVRAHPEWFDKKGQVAENGV